MKSLFWCLLLSTNTFIQETNANPFITRQKLNTKYPTTEIETALSTGNERAAFLSIFPMLVEELTTHMKETHEQPDDACAWVKHMMEYNVPGGKLNRGITVVAVHKTLKGGEITAEEYARAAVLGWAVEFLQAFFLVADDVMDDSETRRGQPCWYKLKNVKNIAINDSFILESFVFTLVKQHFGDEPYYGKLVDLFLEVIQQTEFGQLLDLTSQPDPTVVDLNRFSLERYKKIVKYKTAFYTFYLSVAIGMITSGVTDPSAYDLAKKICCIMGEYFQITDDYLDCYGAPEVIGKIGTDIQDNKCSWLVVQALDRCNAEQRKILEDNYGQWDDAKVQNVKDLYKELELEQVFKDYEEASYKEICAEIEKVTVMPKDVFLFLLKKIYKRDK